MIFFNWINENMKNYSPLTNSEFSEVFGNNTLLIENQYVPPADLASGIKLVSIQN